ncbi:MAG: CHAP domain-containing protein [Myxococcota bacterium]
MRPVGRVEPFALDVADAARHYLEHAPKGFRDDCSGFVLAVLDRAGLELEGNTASLYTWAADQGLVHHHKVPRPGDLAFFDDTYDRNDNGKLDDDLSHIAVVMEVRPDGTILLAQAGTSRGRTTLTMNLREPDLHEDGGGEVLNDWLRVKRDSDPTRTEYLAGELWRAFATIDPQQVAAAEPSRAASARRVP